MHNFPSLGPQLPGSSPFGLQPPLKKLIPVSHGHRTAKATSAFSTSSALEIHVCGWLPTWLTSSGQYMGTPSDTWLPSPRDVAGLN